jgi:hypothetical protein
MYPAAASRKSLLLFSLLICNFSGKPSTGGHSSHAAQLIQFYENSNHILILQTLHLGVACDIFMIVKRLGAPLTQAFGF